ncbi:urease accessory protein UreD [Clostridium thermobutyricum]|uniref:Urease accessory protein UreD n=1 Tax=Clostridium thermobutyricum DSM 4928 TaxID=1121339 RepID=A0A1V4SSH6_9CLOT|nr:urease accessory protein UreD [Clostridium thermobutyricum]OPX46838.1 urease accessory protein UreD [Clostridium thermobutyricum DSM 4928]
MNQSTKELDEKKSFDGYIDLVLAKSGEKTITTKRAFDGVMRVSPTLHLDREEISTYFLIQIGGGYVEGERFLNNIELKENARAIVTTQASTKIYKCENKKETYQKTKVILSKNSILEFINDPVILYKDAKYKQENNIYIDKDSTLIYSDGITSGWSPTGEVFKYSSAKLKTNLYYDGELMLIDNLVMEPEKYDVNSIGYLEGYLNFGTLLVINKNIDKKFIENMRKKLEDVRLDVSFGVSSLEINGFILRVIGNLTQDIEKVVNICHNYVRKEILNSAEILIRKY